MSDESTNPSTEGSEGGQPSEANETVPRHVMQKRIAEERKKAEKVSSELAQLREQMAEFEKLREQVAAFEEEKENAGKTAAEKERIRAEKERVKLDKAMDELRAQLAERDQAAAGHLATLRNERATRALMDVLSSEKAINASRAAKYAMTDITITHDDEGGMTASYGDDEGVTIAEAVKSWLRDNDNFLPVPPGGSGTRNGTGARSATPLHELSDDDLIRAANQRRSFGR